MKTKLKTYLFRSLLLSLTCIIALAISIVISSCDPDEPNKLLPLDAIRANEGGTVKAITSNGTAEVVIAANSVVDKNGRPFTGVVTIDIKSYTTQLLADMGVGSVATMTDDPETVLDFVSILEVNLSDKDGHKLNVNSTATLRFPPPDAVDRPVEIPVFSYNESTSKWKEEGTAALDATNNTYVAHAEHFSIWALAKPAYRKVKGKVKDCTGNAVAGLELKINATISVSTTSAGEYEALVKVGKPVSVVLTENSKGYTASAVGLDLVQGPNDVVISLPDMTTNCVSASKYELVTFDGTQHVIPFFVDLTNPAVQTGESYAEWDSLNNKTTIYLREYNLDTAIVVLSYKGAPPVGSVLSSETRKSYSNLVGLDNNPAISAYAIPKPYVQYIRSANFSVSYSAHNIHFEILSVTSNVITGKFYGTFVPNGTEPGGTPRNLNYELQNGNFSVTRIKKLR
jgi:hypothetical protein